MYFKGKKRMFKCHSVHLWFWKGQNYTHFNSGDPVATQYDINGGDIGTISEFRGFYCGITDDSYLRESEAQSSESTYPAMQRHIPHYRSLQVICSKQYRNKFHEKLFTLGEKSWNENKCKLLDCVLCATHRYINFILCVFGSFVGEASQLITFCNFITFH
jgi:hypothetical protein